MDGHGRVRAPARKNGPRVATFSELAAWHYIETADVARLLRAASRLLRSRGWTQRHGAVRRDGSPCGASDPEAAMFSLNGAIMRAQADLGLEWTHALAAGAVIRETVHMAPLSFNETRGRTADEILDAIYRAIWRVSQDAGVWHEF